MKLIGLIVCLVLSFSTLDAHLDFIEVKYPLNGTDTTPGTVWPMPLSWTGTSDKVLYLDQKKFKMVSTLRHCDIIQESIKLYKNILFPPKIYQPNPPVARRDAMLWGLKMSIADKECPTYPTSSMNESYTLKIGRGIAHVKAQSVWGALKGLETFSQLTWFTKDGAKLAINDSTVIEDEPRFSYRGLLLDTARHYIPVPLLKKNIDAMMYSKLNVFHWHIVDDQSFPLESKTYPNLTEARFTPAHVYTQDDVKDIVEHARLRGIRVIPEFDSPGHVNSFGKLFPKLITVCWKDNKPYQAIYSVQGKAEIFNPTLDELYPIVESVLAELKTLFVDEYIHLGMDEVYYECWKSNPQITEWMKNQNMTSYHSLEAYYSGKVLNIAKGLGKKVTVWQDVWDNGVELDKSTQIQIWKDTSILPYHKKWSQYLSEVTNDGYSAILSSPWYINFIKYGYQDWYRFYQVEPMTNFTGDASKLIGGEAALWSEYVDGTNIATRLWPRASAVAERLWSQASVNDTEDAKFRLDDHRCRLLRRGIAAAPILNGYCGDYEYGMKNSVVHNKAFNYDWPA